MVCNEPSVVGLTGKFGTFRFGSMIAFRLRFRVVNADAHEIRNLFPNQVNFRVDRRDCQIFTGALTFEQYAEFKDRLADAKDVWHIQQAIKRKFDRAQARIEQKARAHRAKREEYERNMLDMQQALHHEDIF